MNVILKINFLGENKVNIAKKGGESRAKCSPPPPPTHTHTHTHTDLLYLYLNVGQRKPPTSPIGIETKTTHTLGGALSKYGEQRHFKLTRFLYDSRSEYCSEQQCGDGTSW